MDTRFVQHPSLQGRQFRSSPRSSGTLWANYTLPVNNLSVGGGAVFAEKRYGDDANSFVVPGYIRGDVMARYLIFASKWKI